MDGYSQYRTPPRSPAGYTYIGLLIMIALMGAGLAGTGQLWRTTVQRDKEAELLFIGEEFRRAIALYYDGTPATATETAKQLPQSLEDLVRDSRYPTVRRYLRKIYHDPITGKPEWGLVRGAGNTIAGVYSLSTDPPFKRAGFPEQYAAFGGAKSYAEWRFIHDGPLRDPKAALKPETPTVEKTSPARIPPLAR